MPENLIRVAHTGDAEAVSAIYAPYVLNTIISFEYQPPSPAEMARRIGDAVGRFPWLVLETPAGIAGYCYATRFGQRAGYDWSCETSIYVAGGAHHNGTGRALYTALLGLLAMQGYRNAYARISSPNPQSEGFHLRMGFRLEGTLQNVGYKFGRSLNTACYVYPLLPVTSNPPPPRPFAALDDGQVAALLAGALA